MDIPVMTRLRLARGDMSREDVAAACDISVSALGMYENGQRVPRDEIKVKLAKLYGKTVEELFF
jgi:DNA-binding XRE family transcriptional regulator